MSLLSLRALTLRIGAVQVCRDLDLDFGPGQCWAILGRNGVGKSTLLAALAGLHPPVAGEVRLRGRPLHRLPRRQVAQSLGIVFQAQQDPFPATVFETALAGRHPHLPPWGLETPEDHARAEAALAAFDLLALREREVHRLSGGERQRLAIATLFAQDPAVMLLDEPTHYLDLRHEVQVMQRLRERADAGSLVIMVLHDPNLAARWADGCLLLAGEGRAEHGRCAALLTTERLGRLYQQPLRALGGESPPLWVPDTGRGPDRGGA